tara:strand:+ start:2468 stop:3160 length:693 start_codon:yes stop_codon:yes gene_type:complete
MSTLSQKRALHQETISHRGVHAINKSIGNLAELSQTPNGQVKLGTAEAAAVQGLEAVPIADPNERPGWLYVKGAADPKQKFNYFHYGQGTQAMLLSHLTTLHSILTVDTYTSAQSLPFFNVFTLADASSPNASWYKSKITYSMSPGQHMILGESVQCWSIEKPLDHTGKRFVEFNTKQVDGAGLPNETIQYITVHSDSSSPVGTQILVQQVGYNLFKAHNVVESRMALIA